MVLVVPGKKMRVEVFDSNGNRYTITFEGKVTREKALCILDVMELLGGIHDDQRITAEGVQRSKFDKTRSLVKNHFSSGWFSSKEVLVVYEEEFHEPISLSTVSTYLTRLADRGILIKINATKNIHRYFIIRLN